MNNIVLAVDELDHSLGSFFGVCRDELTAFLESNGMSHTLISSNRLNDLAITMTTQVHSSFVFGAYSHGSNECLAKQNPWTPFISRELNGAAFNNSFFYTFSCSSGLDFGRDIISQGCLCFIGYNKPVAIWNTWIKPFVNCANYGLTQFFLGYQTHDIINQMSQRYDEEIDSIYEKDYLIASILFENKNALVIHGSNISKIDL
jgi:hypothetical protein